MVQRFGIVCKKNEWWNYRKETILPLYLDHYSQRKVLFSDIVIEVSLKVKKTSSGLWTCKVFHKLRLDIFNGFTKCLYTSIKKLIKFKIGNLRMIKNVQFLILIVIIYVRFNFHFYNIIFYFRIAGFVWPIFIYLHTTMTQGRVAKLGQNKLNKLLKILAVNGIWQS